MQAKNSIAYFAGADFNVVAASHNGHSERSRGCNAADKVREARLLIPRHNSKATCRAVSTALDMTNYS